MVIDQHGKQVNLSKILKVSIVLLPPLNGVENPQIKKWKLDSQFRAMGF
jgi:hypothetical protein